MKHYIIWYTDECGEEEYEDYTIIQAKDIRDAHKKANKMFGEYVISVERYEP